MVRYARKVLKIREQSSFGPKFPVEFVPVFQKDLRWPNGYLHTENLLRSRLVGSWKFPATVAIGEK